jgi:hypothetical protein
MSTRADWSLSAVATCGACRAWTWSTAAGRRESKHFQGQARKRALRARQQAPNPPNCAMGLWSWLQSEVFNTHVRDCVIVVLIVLGPGVGMIAGGAAKIAGDAPRRRAIENDWLPVNATFTWVETWSYSGCPDVIYHYTWEGQAYTSHDIIAGDRRKDIGVSEVQSLRDAMDKGELAPVWIDPDDPHVCRHREVARAAQKRRGTADSGRSVVRDTVGVRLLLLRDDFPSLLALLRERLLLWSTWLLKAGRTVGRRCEVET